MGPGTSRATEPAWCCAGSPVCETEKRRPVGRPTGAAHVHHAPRTVPSGRRVPSSPPSHTTHTTAQIERERAATVLGRGRAGPASIPAEDGPSGPGPGSGERVLSTPHGRAAQQATTGCRPAPELTNGATVTAVWRPAAGQPRRSARPVLTVSRHICHGRNVDQSHSITFHTE